LLGKLISAVHLTSVKVMENLESYAQGFEHEVHVHCKRSLGTLLFSFVILLVTSL